ncbi:MAG: hypothetical protein QGI86_26250 [Candidatus Poribacteria bacterium]|jgi:hypothetical protein|nr:hypothetical protein [Candidatus Poribacteria bacterium]MDP6751307.1 hypothetical protein [Candidatus Poribacteria bacterium]
MRTAADQRLQTIVDQEGQIAPNQQQLVELKRDPQFRPVDLSDDQPLTYLTHHQIDHFNQFS